MNPGLGGAQTATVKGRIFSAAGIFLFSVAVSLVILGAVLFTVSGGYGRTEWGLPGVQILWALGFLVAGYPITRRHPESAVGWLLLAAGVTASVNLLGLGGNAASNDPGGPSLWLAGTWVFSVAALSSAVVFFPSGSPPSRWWWVQLAVLWGSSIPLYLYAANTQLSSLPEWPDPLAVLLNIVFQISLAAGCFSLLVRWRRSGSVERLQLKWVVYGTALVGIAALAVEVLVANLVPSWHFPGTVVLSIFIVAIPAAIGVAMLRYRLYDVDVVINRTLVYAVLTLALALVYLGCVVSLHFVFHTLTGNDSQLAVVASTLAIAALFNPLRYRVQAFVDRRFYRKKYDAAKTLSAFGERLRDEVELDKLGDGLVEVVRHTMQPEHSSLWLKPPDHRRMK